jgi:hypothetical protein
MRGKEWAVGARIKILAGHYGSGKTEIALNMALSIKRAGLETALIDLDIVNPFFRSADRGAWLAQNDIALIAPNFALSAVDVMSLPPEIMSVFARAQLSAIFDIGGDDAGAAALGQYYKFFDAAGYELLYVINIYRPRSFTAGDILNLIERVSLRSRLTPAGLINNANLGPETTHVELERGIVALREVSDRSGLPIVASCGTAEALKAFSGSCAPEYQIERLMAPEWM